MTASGGGGGSDDVPLGGSPARTGLDEREELLVGCLEEMFEFAIGQVSKLYVGEPRRHGRRGVARDELVAEVAVALDA